MNAHLSQQEHKSHLGGAASLLRALIDDSDCRQYCFPLLLFKRLPDVWKENFQKAFDDTCDARYASATACDRFELQESALPSEARIAEDHLRGGLSSTGFI